MNDVRQAAEERAARPKGSPVGASFESERQREKNAFVRQIDALDGRNVRKIAAAAETPEEDRVLRVAAYCRVSTDDIDQKLSIHLQIQEYMRKIKSNPSWKYAGCYVDLSRFGRNYKETGNYLERIFPFLGVRFIAVNDGFDTLTAQRGADGYLVPLKNLINEVYSKDISRKSGSVLAAKQKNGDFIGAWAPYGYRKQPDNPHKLEPDEATAPVVRQIFRWRAEGVSVTQIARRLNDEGVPSPSAYLYNTGACKTEKYNGVSWYVQTVKNLLSRQVYIGHMVQGRKRQSFYENRGQY